MSLFLTAWDWLLSLLKSLLENLAGSYVVVVGGVGVSLLGVFVGFIAMRFALSLVYRKG